MLTLVFLTPLTSLTWAYQLHHYICFRTYRRRDFFSDEAKIQALSSALTSLSSANDYHLLEMKVRPADVQLVLSLQPHHSIADVLKKLKGRSSTFLCPQLDISPSLWARGYLARSIGKVRLQAVKSIWSNRPNITATSAGPCHPYSDFAPPTRQC